MTGMEPLAPLCLEVVRLFRLINAIKNPMPLGIGKEPDEWPKGRFAAEADRFELWAVNLGVFVSGHGSLDYRIRDASSIKDTLHRFLKSLIESLEEALEYLNGETHLSVEEEEEAASDTESEPESDMDLLLDSVKDPIDRLFKLSIWIRNPATRLASSKAQRFQQIDEETNVNLLDVFEAFDYNHVSSLFLQYKKHVALQEKPTVPAVEDEGSENDDHVWEPVRTVLSQHKNSITNGTESYLIRRITQANVRRRQQFAYWRRHRDKLRQHAIPVVQQDPTSSQVQGPTQLSIGVRIDCNTPLTEAQSVTTASRLNLPQTAAVETMSTVSVSEYAPSTWQPSKDVVDFPPPPRIQPTEKFFECPYCFTLCSTALLAEKAWKAHLIHDLRPYICTYEECRNPDQLYDSRQDWIEHENSTHRRVFRCLEHEDQTFATLASYQEHTHEQHGSGALSHESILLNHTGESTLVGADRCCPVCSLAIGTAQSMQNHIALHLERLAMFSMPRWVVDGEDSARGAGSADANLDSENHRTEDLGADDASQGELEELEAVFVRELEDKKKTLEPNHLSIIETLQNLGDLYSDQGKLAEAEAMYEQALEGSEQALGPDHISTLEAAYNLGNLYMKHGRLDKAETMYNRALEGTEQTLGPDHISTLSVAYNLGNLYAEQGRLSEAEAMYNRALQGMEEAYGPSGIRKFDVVQKLGDIYAKQGWLSEAEAMYNRALQGREQVLGPDDPPTLDTVHSLGNHYMKQGRLNEAETMYKRVLKGREQVLGPENSSTLDVVHKLGSLYAKQGRFTEAEKMFVRVLDRRQEVLGEKDPETLKSMHDLAIIWHALGRHDQALPLMRKCVEWQQSILGDGHLNTVVSANQLRRWEGKTTEP